MNQHPREKDQWDGSHWKQVVQLAQQQAWEDMKQYIERTGKIYLKEHMETLLQLASPRLYHSLWGANDAL